MDLHLSRTPGKASTLCSQSPQPLLHQAYARVQSFLQLRWRAIMHILDATPFCLRVHLKTAGAGAENRPAIPQPESEGIGAHRG